MDSLSSAAHFRGQRPSLRGWFHLVAAIVGALAGVVLFVVAALRLTPLQTLSVGVYVVGVVLLFGVSAAYHRGPWKTPETVAWWRRADHSTIAVFIAATYTPMCAIALNPQAAKWMLSIAWVGALASVVMNLVWITHPRLLGTAIYLVLGWLIVPLIPELWRNAGSTVVWLLAAGGVVYTLGAVVYAIKWPGRHAKVLGFHEIFHAATIVAAVLHMIAVWIVVMGAAHT
ncbi:PAQR family membrane homeostasis protein TrhA [Corynebacterium aquilae]|uniref:Membrane protein n=1 Tax=Corynebacterium aquilae DSM 44791 TaxID=1431546 RepID=A0A1L7CIR1_9CORY|nr:hemolysin III family protein [Corynebacterium aquilae]APT85746.1 membrane protein [Corynebacterium aquilae DSM 44791]